MIGNGPSLNRIDMSRLKSEITFGSNRVYQGFEKWGFGFTYWSIEDMLVAEDIADEWTREMIGSPRYATTVFVPQDLMHHVRHRVSHYEDRCVQINFVRKEYYPSIFPFSNDPSEVMWGGTVTYLLLQLAAIMGCDPIILLGIDFNYTIPRSIRHLGEGRLMSTEDDLNHFFPEYFGKGRKWHDPHLPRMRVAYLSAEKASRKLGFRIYNATPGTKLRVIPRIDYSKALSAQYISSFALEGARVALANINIQKAKYYLSFLTKRFALR